MKHFIIRPDLGEINEVFYLDKSEPKYQWIQRMIGGNFDCVDINDEGDTIYVNDEGLLKNSNYFFEVNSPLYEKPYPLAGTRINYPDGTKSPFMVSMAHITQNITLDDTGTGEDLDS